MARFTGGGRFAAQPAAPAKSSSSGPKLPSLGVSQLFRELGGGLTGLARLALPGSRAGEPGFEQAGKGLASSMIGTGTTFDPLANLPFGLSRFDPVLKAAKSSTAHVLGEEYTPQTLQERIAKRGILPAVVEDIGNASIVGGIAGKAATLGDVGRLANADVATARAADLAEMQAGTKGAARAATAATKAAGKASEIDAGAVDAGAISRRATFIRGAHDVAHPYHALFEKGIRPITRAANADVLDQGTVAEAAQAQAPATTPQATNVAETAGVHPDVRSYYQRYGAALGAQPPTAVGVKGAMADDAAARIAQAYLDDGFHKPEDPKVQAAYQQFKLENTAQFKYMTDSPAQGGLGVKVEFVTRDRNPYVAGLDMSNPEHVREVNARMAADVSQNNHLFVDATGADETHPFMSPAENDQFRAVHDFFGHQRAGTQFDRGGEEVAYQHHAQMYSPAAREALATETRGQNTVLNYSPENVARVAAGEPAQFPDQKVGVLPPEFVDPLYGHRTAAEATADGVYLGGGIETPSEMAAKARAAEPVPQWAQRFASHAPESAKAVLAAGERRIQSWEMRHVYADRRRMVESSRQAAMKSPAVAASIDAAQELLQQRTLPDGSTISRQMASDMVGAELNRRITGLKSLTDTLQGEHSQAALAEIGALQDPIPKEAWTPELEGKIQRAADLWREESQARMAALSADRVGTKGIGDQTDVQLSRSDERLVKQIELDKERLGKLDVRRAKEAAAADRTIARADDFIARRAEEIDALRKRQDAAVTAFDQSRMPKALPKTPAEWEPFVQATAENGGGTFDPRTGIETPRAFATADSKNVADGWAVSALDVTTVPADQWAAFNPQTGVTLGAEALHRTALDFQDLIATNPDIRLGTWVNDGQVYVDLSQHTINGRAMSRDEALLLGAARKQKAIMDFSTGEELVPTGRPDLASQFVKRTFSWAQPTYRERRAVELRQLVDKGVYTHEQIDAWMSAMDAAAWSLHEAGKVANPDDAYRLYKVGFRKAVAAIAADPRALLQMALPSTDLKSIWDEAHQSIANADEMKRWYHASHDAIEARWRGKDVTLLDGSHIDGADLVYDLLAVTSVNTQPLVNLGNALHGITNMVSFTKEMAGNQAAVERMVEEFVKSPGEVKSNTELFQRLTKNAHMYTVPKQSVFDILQGNTLDKWTPETLQRNVELWARKTSKAGMKMEKVPQELIDRLGPDRAFTEWYGGNAWAKLQSFRENLRDPLTSRAVTLDVWMARLFGLKDWLKPGDYAEFAGKIRDFSDQLTEQLGTPVQPHEVQALFWAYAKKELTDAATVSKQNLGQKLNAQDFESILAKPNKRLNAVMDELSAAFDKPAGEALLQKFGNDIRGALLVSEDSKTPSAMTFFKTADATTLVHEHAHLLRQLVPQKMLAAIEVAYGVKDHVWDRAAEERFADDFVRYMGGSAPVDRPHLTGAFGIVQAALGEQWRFVRGPLLGQSIAPEAQALMDHLLDPPQAGYADLGIKGLPEAEQTLAQRSRLAPRLGESPAQMYGRGMAGGKSVVEVQRIEDAIKSKMEAQAKALSVRSKVERTLAEHTLPSELDAAKLGQKTAKRSERLLRSLDNPSVARTPAVWQPLWGAVTALTEAAKDNPQLATELEGMPQTLSQVIEHATAAGFDPAHVRSFTPAEVHRLVFEGIQLGRPGRDVSQTIEAGTRKMRRGAFARDQSIEALVASQIEVAHEINTNALVDYIEGNLSKDIVGGQIPHGWVAWDGERRFILTGERTPQGGVSVQEGFATSKPQKMIPLEVKKALGAYQKDYRHWTINAVGKVTNPWRALILTWTPRWYVNNVLGNTILATVEGVKLQDWRRAWESYRRGFADTPGVVGHSIVSELGDHTTVIPRSGGFEGLKEAARTGMAEGGRPKAMGEVYRQAAHQMQRVNEVVDEMSRAAVYFSNKRAGLSSEAALQRAFTAMVDYGDMTPFERSIVKTVVPFYTWQKAMLKLVAKYPIDHPQAAAVTMQLGQLNEKAAENMNLPQGYESLVPISGLGMVNLRGINPFQDAGQLTSPQGIAGSMNPFLDIMVRNAMGAPDGGFTKLTRMNDWGVAVPDTSPAQDLTQLATNLPQARFGEQLAGNSAPGQPGAIQGTSRFFGIPTYTPAQVQKIQDRVKKQRKRLPGQ